MEKMEKYVIQLTYLGGVASVMIAILWRALNFLGYGLPVAMSPGKDLYYMSFYKAALILLLASIAASNYASYISRKS